MSSDIYICVITLQNNLLYIQAHVKDIVSSVLDHLNKVIQIFWFPNI